MEANRQLLWLRLASFGAGLADDVTALAVGMYVQSQIVDEFLHLFLAFGCQFLAVEYQPSFRLQHPWDVDEEPAFDWIEFLRKYDLALDKMAVSQCW